MSPVNAANAWADALLSVSGTVLAGGAPVVPGSLEAKAEAFKASLVAFMSAPSNMVTVVTGFANSVGTLWMGIPFTNTGVVTDVEVGKGPLIAGTVAGMPPTPDPATAGAAFAGYLIGYLQSILVTIPGTPPVVVPLV